MGKITQQSIETVGKYAFSKTEHQQTNVQYCIVKNIEENCLQIVPKEQVKSSNKQDLYTVRYASGKECHVILIHTGEKEEMERSLRELFEYERLNKKYSSLYIRTRGTQTVSQTSTNVERTDGGDDDIVERCMGSELIDFGYTEDTESAPPPLVLVPDTPNKPTSEEASIPSAFLDEIPPTPETPEKKSGDSVEDNSIATDNLPALLPVFLRDANSSKDSLPATGHVCDPETAVPNQQLWDPLTSNHTYRPTSPSDAPDKFSEEYALTDISHQQQGDSLAPHLSSPYVREDSLSATGHVCHPETAVPRQQLWDPLTSNHTYRPTSPSDVPGNNELQENVDAVDPAAETNEIFQKHHSKKKHCCKYCLKVVGNFSRHLTIVHCFEEDVVEYINLKTRSEKLSQLRKIIAEGDELYNQNHPTSPIVRRKSGTGLEQRSQCPNCKMFFSVKYVVFHLRKCNPETVGLTGAALRVQVNRERVLNKETLSEPMKTHILPFMRNDSVRHLCEVDPGLILYGNKMCERLMGEGQEKTIRNHLRILGRVTERAIEESEGKISSTLDLFEPQNYTVFVNAIHEICGYGQAEGQEMEKPTTPHQYGPKMRDLSDYLVTELLKKMNPANEDDVDQIQLKQEVVKIEGWQKIYDRDYDRQVASLGRKQADRRTYDSKQLTPSMDDVQKLLNLIEDRTASSYNKLKTQFSMEDFIMLNKCLLLRLWIFNRRRVGEVDKLRLKNWLNAKTIDEASDQFKALSPTEQHFAASFNRITVQGKLRRPVALLAPKKDMPCFELIISLRNKAKVSKENPYLFATQDRYIEGTGTMNEFSRECGAKNWRLLTGTRLRKQLAASLRYLNLTDEDLRLVAESMGHTEKTHITKYRMHDPALHAGRMSRVLMSIDDGTITNYVGKSIDEIDGSVLVDAPLPSEYLHLANLDAEEKDSSNDPEPSTSTKRPSKPMTDPEETELTPIKRVCRYKKKLKFESDDEEKKVGRVRGSTPGRRRAFSKRKPHRKTKISTKLKAALQLQMAEEIKQKKCPSTARVLQAIAALENEFPEIVNHSPKKVKVLVSNWSRHDLK